MRASSSHQRFLVAFVQKRGAIYSTPITMRRLLIDGSHDRLSVPATTFPEGLLPERTHLLPCRHTLLKDG